jgi:geranylgeranylglycerol-phosphate geranylgeranyltransferase
MRTTVSDLKADTYNFFVGKLSALMRLTRIEHALMLVLGVWIGETVSLGMFPALFFAILSAIPPFFIEMGSFAINDYFDIETDRKNKRTDRPLVSKELSPEFAKSFAYASLVFGILSALAVGTLPFFISFAFGALAYLYSYRLKDLPLIGNIYIALSMAIPFAYGSVAVSGTMSSVIWIIFGMAFFSGLGREIAKSIQDMKGDSKARKSKTLPILLGREKSATLSYLLIVAAVALSPFPPLFDSSLINIYYYLPIACADVAFLCSAFIILIAKDAREFSLARNLTLLALNLGLVGFLAGALAW